MKSRVASLDPWLQTLSGRLIDGEKLFLRSLPGLGKTFICEQLADILGPSAVVIRGRQVGAVAPIDTAQAIAHKIVATVESESCAQLLFDDYSRALRSAAGQQLQAVLHGLLINSEVADVVGALVVSRWGEKLNVPKAGSPLLSRLDYLAEPRWIPTDVPAGHAPESVEREIGGTAGMLALALGHDGRYDPQRITSHLDLHVDTILKACTPTGLDYLAGRCTCGELKPTDQEPLQALLVGNSLSSAAKDSQLRTVARSRTQGWPPGVHASAATFASLLEGEQRAMWVDRFLFKKPADLRRFLIDVRKLTATRLRLLGSNSPRDPIDVNAIRNLATEVVGVECRALTRVQYRMCHDRHMVFSDNSGHVLPVAEVVLGVGDPGTAITTQAPAFPLDYERIWRDAVRL